MTRIISEKEFETAIEELKEFLRIPSVSADSRYRSDVLRCAEYVAERLTAIGFPTVQKMTTDGFPVVYAECCQAPGKPTILFYGHYDVQPPDPLGLWLSGPFDPDVRDGYLYARGVSDDKGQVYCHFKAFELLFKHHKKLPVNIKILIEGEEEIGSPSLLPFLKRNKDLFRADAAVVSDTPMFSATQPSVCYSLRGLVYLELTVRTGSGDLHSGQHGGAVPNAIHSLLAVLSKLKDADGRVMVPGFYNDVAVIPLHIREELKTLDFTDPEYQSLIGTYFLQGEEGFSSLERRWFRPTLDINGIYGGYTGEGSKTVIPAAATAKISMRLVANQDPKVITAAFRQYLREIMPKDVRFELKEFSSSYPAATDSHHPIIKAAKEALKKVHHKEAVLTGEGGTIPVVSDFKTLLGIPTVLMGFNLPDDAIHAPNERFKLENFKNGIKSAYHFYNQCAALI